MKRILLFLICCFLSTIGFSQLTLQWSPIQSFPAGGRMNVSGFTIGEKAYVGLGLDTTTNGPDDWFEYDTTTKIWTQKGNFPGGGRWATSSFVINGMGYIMGGIKQGAGLVGELWQYNPATDTWTQKASCPGSPRDVAIGFSIDTFGYFGMGWDAANTVYNDMWQYNSQNDSWLQVASLPGPARGGATGFAIDSFGYVGLGADDQAVAYYPDFYKYNPYSNTWSQIDSFPGGTIGGVPAINYDGNAYLVSGFNQSPVTNGYNVHTVYQYSPATSAWTEIFDTFPGVGSGYGFGFSIGGALYYGMGSPNSIVANGQSGFWKATPQLPNGIKDISKTDQLSFYPDPFTDELFAANLQPGVVYTINIYDVVGRTVAGDLRVLGDGSIGYDMSDLKAGTYIIECNNVQANQNSMAKVVKY
jgi:N-acetylneuraminic acid mutarotase